MHVFQTVQCKVFLNSKGPLCDLKVVHSQKILTMQLGEPTYLSILSNSCALQGAISAIKLPEFNPVDASRGFPMELTPRDWPCCIIKKVCVFILNGLSEPCELPKLFRNCLWDQQCKPIFFLNFLLHQYQCKAEAKLLRGWMMVVHQHPIRARL